MAAARWPRLGPVPRLGPCKRRFLLASPWAAATLAACSASAGGTPVPEPAGARYDRTDLEAALDDDRAGLVLGTFPIAAKGIVDGDTLKVEGLDASLRLLAIDTEETFKHESDRRLYESGWRVYLAAKQAETNRPVKIATPLGEEAKHFAERFFAGVKSVELERDHPLELRGRYDRYLTYVFVTRGHTRLHYNVEAVRAGMAPYFPKYGHSRRFRKDFEDAMAEARAAERGIWDPNKEHYPDYDVRLAWWTARGDFVAAFERRAQGRDDHFILGRYGTLERLAAHEGEDVTVLGTVAAIRPTRGGPIRVYLAHRRGADLPIIVFDPMVLDRSGLPRYVGEYVVVRGPVQRYRYPKGGREELQLMVRRPDQVELPPYDPPEIQPDPAGPTRERADDHLEPADPAAPTTPPPDPAPPGASSPAPAPPGPPPRRPAPAPQPPAPPPGPP